VPPATPPPPYPAPPGPPPFGQQQYGQPQYPAPPSLSSHPVPWGDPAGAYASPAPKPGTNGFAIAALVLGIIPICFLGLVFGIVALVQIGKSRQKGKGLAIAGLVLTGLWLVGLVTAGVVSGLNDAHRSDSGSITKAGQLSTEDLRVGDCFNGLDDVKIGDTVRTVTAVPCDKLHEAEDYAHVKLEGSAYPGTTALQDQSTGRPCVDQLKVVAPSTFRARSVSIIWIYPQKLAWRLGNHHLECIAVGLGRRSGSVIEQNVS
jgi:Domain of unknown function (DUF4190)/Septum formation